MNKTINHLRTYRKHTDISQYDIAMLLQLKGNTIVSRTEKGFRSPTIEMIVTYHLLFDIPFESLINNDVALVKDQLLERIPKLIAEIEGTENPKNGQTRVDFLKCALNRLTQTVS